MTAQAAIAATSGSNLPCFVELPQPGAPAHGEVLCRTLQLGICGTDREILASKKPWTPQGESFLALGHECLARVEAVGVGVTKFRVGQLVVPTVRRPLISSPIRPDMLAFGEYIERGIVKHHGFSQPLWLEQPEFLLPVEPELADAAVFAEPQSVAEKAVNEAIAVQRGRLGEQIWTDPPPQVLVTGQGPIAFAALIACITRNWPVTMMGRDAGESYRVELARDLGAASYVSFEESRLDGGDVERNGFDLLLECTGSDEVLLYASQSLVSRGVAVWLGAARDPQPATHNVDRLMRIAILRNHIHLGSVNAAMRDFVDALDHLRMLQYERPASVARLFTKRVAFEDSLVEYTSREPQSVKVVVHFAE